MIQEDKFRELEERLQKLESEVFGKSARSGQMSVGEHSGPSLKRLNIPLDILATLRARIRKVSYWNLVLTLLHFSHDPLKLTDIMSLSKELNKPIPYEWFDTDFHRKKYSGRVRSEAIPGSKEKVYSLNEPRRRKAEAFLASLKEPNKQKNQ